MKTDNPSRCKSTLHSYLTVAPFKKLLPVLLLLTCACNSKNKNTSAPLMKFDKTKWSASQEGHYTYLSLMVNDLLSSYQWVGVKKDSVIILLGQPDAWEERSLRYDYEKTPLPIGFGN